MIRHTNFRTAAPEGLDPAERWQDNAECRRPEYDKIRDLWYSDRKQGDVQYAVGICTTACPVRDACRQYALNRGEEFGIWGGLTERDRRRIFRKAARERTEQRKEARSAEAAA